jgi:hypothetical protein
MNDKPPKPDHAIRDWLMVLMMLTGIALGIGMAHICRLAERMKD